MIAGVFAATVLGLIFGVLEPPDGVIDAPSSDSFSTIGDALDPTYLGDALTVALIPVIFALFMTDFFDRAGCWTTRAGCRTPTGCCSSTRAPPHSAARWACRA